MNRRLSLVLLACGGWLLAPGAQAGAAEPADAQDFFFKGGDACLYIRVHAKVGERPLPSAWRDAVAKLHAYLDTSAVGSVALNEELADFAEMIRSPLALRESAAGDTSRDTTFARLDLDHDGSITPAEAAQAEAILLRFDQNGDEVLSPSELTAYQSANMAMMPAEPQQAKGPESPVLVLDRAGSRIKLVQQVLTRFDTRGVRGGRDKDQRLARAELRLPPALFREFDANHDGALDSFELMELLDRGAPSVELALLLTTRATERNTLALAQPDDEEVSGAKEARGVRDAPRASTRKRSGQTVVTVEAAGLLLVMRADQLAWDLDEARERCEQLFDDLDFDDSKSLSGSEARGQEPFAGLFRLMDRDGDGQLVREEMRAVLTLLEGLWRGHAVLTVQDRGAQLFANLDTSGDGRLSVRELRAAAARIASFDRNHDGKLTAAEVPHKYELALSQAPPPPGLAMRKKGAPAAADEPAAINPAGPRWFQKMDRNQDGDVSAREFLGPPAVFRRLDADSDGLLDPQEAQAAGQPSP